MKLPLTRIAAVGAFTLLTAGLPMPARAQGASTGQPGLAELSLESLLDMQVSGASRFLQRRSQAASAVTVITREEITALGYRTLAEALRSVRGVSVFSDRTYDYIGVRGFQTPGDYNTRVLLLVDGNRINDALYDQAYIGSEFPLDLDLVERIEFIPGGGSAVYGANALFGIINVITREPSRHGLAQGTLGLGSARDRDLRAMLRWPFEGGGLQLQGSHRRADGPTVFDANQVGVNGSDGYSRATDGLERQALGLRLDLGEFTAGLTHAQRTKGVAFTTSLIYGDPHNRYRDTFTQLNMERTIALSASTSLSARAYAAWYVFDGYYAVDYPPPTLNQDLGRAHWRGLEARVKTVTTSGQRIVAGMEAEEVPQLVQRNYDTSPSSVVYLDDERRSARASIYIEDQLPLAAGTELHAGLRGDRVFHRTASEQWETSPRLALLWTPASGATAKFIHGQAFRQPNAYEAYYVVDSPGGYRANPSQQTERVRSDEFVLEWRAAAAWRWSASLYRNRATRLLSTQYDALADRYEVVNSGTLVAKGGEVEVEYFWQGARLRANLSGVRARYADGSASSYPSRMGKGTAVLPLRGDWTLGLETEAASRRGAAAGFAVLHATVQGSAGPGGAQLLLGVRNVSDASVSDPGSDPQRQPTVPTPGRQWQARLRWPLTF